jgi:hypothetical protein
MSREIFTGSKISFPVHRNDSEKNTDMADSEQDQTPYPGSWRELTYRRQPAGNTDLFFTKAAPDIVNTCSGQANLSHGPEDLSGRSINVRSIIFLLSGTVLTYQVLWSNSLPTQKSTSKSRGSGGIDQKYLIRAGTRPHQQLCCAAAL